MIRLETKTAPPLRKPLDRIKKAGVFPLRFNSSASSRMSRMRLNSHTISSMNGDGFESKVKQGQMVRKGEELLLIDLKKIADAGHPATVITVVTNTHEFAEVRQAAVGNVEAGATLLKVGK